MVFIESNKKCVNVGDIPSCRYTDFTLSFNAVNYSIYYFLWKFVLLVHKRTLQALDLSEMFVAGTVTFNKASQIGYIELKIDDLPSQSKRWISSLYENRRLDELYVFWHFRLLKWNHTKLHPWKDEHTVQDRISITYTT